MNRRISFKRHEDQPSVAAVVAIRGTRASSAGGVFAFRAIRPVAIALARHNGIGAECRGVLETADCACTVVRDGPPRIDMLGMSVEVEFPGGLVADVAGIDGILLLEGTGGITLVAGSVFPDNDQGGGGIDRSRLVAADISFSAFTCSASGREGKRDTGMDGILQVVDVIGISAIA